MIDRDEDAPGSASEPDEPVHGAGAGPDAQQRRPGPLSFQPEDPDEEARRWGHRQDPDLEPAASVGVTDAPPPRPRSPHVWLFGLVVALILVYIALNALPNVGSVTRGVEPGRRLPPFAVPLAQSRLDGDANVATGPQQGQSGNRPACQVRGRAILNSCQLTEAAPAVLAFVAVGDPACAGQLDRFQRQRGRFNGVRFAAVVARTDRARLRAQIRRRGWRFPVGYDRDGAVFTRYGVVDCPTITFSYPGGVAMRTTVKPLSDRQLADTVAALAAGSKRRGWKQAGPA